MSLPDRTEKSGGPRYYGLVCKRIRSRAPVPCLLGCASLVWNGKEYVCKCGKGEVPVEAKPQTFHMKGFDPFSVSPWERESRKDFIYYSNRKSNSLIDEIKDEAVSISTFKKGVGV